MKLMRYTTSFIFAVTFSNPAYAYLDPGAGSFILQMFIAGIMGALYTLKLYWYGLKSFILRILGKEIEETLVNQSNDNEPDKLKKQN